VGRLISRFIENI